MRPLVLVLAVASLAATPAAAAPRAKAPPPAAPAKPPAPPVSPATQGCLDCHADMTPGIVADWRASRHARVTLADALAVPAAGRRVSAAAAPEGTGPYVVGCAECHAARADAHPDAFDHEGTRIHTVVSPPDCARCHPDETDQFADNLMSHANGNLAGNALYRDLVHQVLAPMTASGASLAAGTATDDARSDACYSCHGTVVTVAGSVTRDTDAGSMTFPVLANWPNQGVGRVNPDGSAGACTACHPRHGFSIAVARSAGTCAECHKGPDVPAYPVWAVSKHGAIATAQSGSWDMTAVPWAVGRDFTAPTCAACHVSQLVTASGSPIVPRTHRMNDRLAFRLFGLPYSHPHPVSPDTTSLRSADGLPLPVALDGTLAPGLIDAAEQDRRVATFESVCRACHGQTWVAGHFARLRSALAETDGQTRAATGLVQEAWRRGLATGPGKGSPFDEPIERSWVEQWLFFANSTRFAAAMAGADYGTFANGRWNLARNLREIAEWLRDHAPARKR